MGDPDMVIEAKRWLAERDAEKKTWRQPAQGICGECGAPIVQGGCECDERVPELRTSSLPA